MIKVQAETERVCIAKANEAGQSHLFRHWDELPGEARRRLIDDLESISFQQIKRLVNDHQRRSNSSALASTVVEPPREVVRLDAESETRRRELREIGEKALRDGHVALVTLAGGTGCGPLGEPTGFLPVGPLSAMTLFQLHAEKIRALVKRFGASLCWYLVVHPEQLDETRGFFKKHAHFGLSSSAIRFLAQPRLPLVDRRGRFLQSAPGRIALEPNGNGGVLEDLVAGSHLEELRAAGVEHAFFFQVDNPLVRVADPVFVGHHMASGCEVSSKAIARTNADETVGVFCRSGETCGVVSHENLPEQSRQEKDEDGELTFSAGNLAVHAFRLEFLERLRKDAVHLPFHARERTAACVDRRGRMVKPTEPNCLEFNCFLFDALWLARSSTIVLVNRDDEFSPIRQTSGPHSPQTAQRDLSSLYARWLRACGAHFESRAVDALPTIEISPLFALDADELRAKIELPMSIGSDLLLAGG